MPLRSRFPVAFAALAALIAFTVMPARSAPEPYVIPVILPLTGAAANTGTLAGQSLRVFETYANAHGGLRGQPIHFDIHDDGSQIATSVQLLNAAIATHPAVVLGPSPTQTCNALAPLVEKAGPVLYCSTPGTLPQFDRGIIRYMRLKGYHKLAIISSNDGSGQANDAATRAMLALPESSGLHVVTWEHMNPTDIDATAQAAHVKNSGTEAIIMPLTPNGANVNPDELSQFNDFLPKEMPLAAYRGAGVTIAPGGTGSVPLRR
jgi:branched-chain amino acid transport system substrate-binding protein